MTFTASNGLDYPLGPCGYVPSSAQTDPTKPGKNRGANRLGGTVKKPDRTVLLVATKGRLVRRPSRRKTAGRSKRFR